MWAFSIQLRQAVVLRCQNKINKYIKSVDVIDLDRSTHSAAISVEMTKFCIEFGSAVTPTATDHMLTLLK